MFEVLRIGGHVRHADLVVEAPAGPAHPGHHQVAGSEFGHRRTDLLDPPQTLVAQDQEVGPLGHRPVLPGVYLSVGAIQSNAEDPHQDSPSSWDVLEGRLRDLPEPAGELAIAMAPPSSRRHSPLRSHLRYARGPCNESPPLSDCGRGHTHTTGRG